MSNDNNRNATQVDAGWRSKVASAQRNATQVDAGWRNNTSSAQGNATKVDVGWRNADNTRTATQVDAGWRNDTSSAQGNATKVDVGWRNADNTRTATQVDAGWRNDTSSAQGNATKVDDGWRKEAAKLLDPENIMNSATANYFNSLDSFKDAMEKLTALKTSTGNIYPIKETISKEGGESIILLCSDPYGNDIAAKIYYEPVNGIGSAISTRSHVLEYMGTEEGKRYTLAVSEIGLVEFGISKYYFEIIPYCPNTDLSDDGALSFERLVEITKQLNEGLCSIHKAGIIHRDIKPENLYEIDGQIKLGDFGIARSVDNSGRSKATEKIAGTEGYAAPETRLYRYSEKSDYYSLGVTLASLFEGRYVFSNMNYDMQSASQESERLPLMRVHPKREQLENLLNGLCRVNVKQRFGYKDVKLWLTDHNYTGGAFDEEWPKPFRLFNEIYRDERSMFEGITQDERHWDEAKEMLYKKYIEQFFASFRTDLARAAQISDELYRTENSDKGLAIFLKNLYAPGPIVWKGSRFNSLSELGSKMVATKNPVAYAELLQNRCISHWLSNTDGIQVNEETFNLVDEIEALSVTEPEIACYWFGNSFAPERSLVICNRKVSSIAELIVAMFNSPNDFYQTDGYSKLISRTDGADFYGFLFSFGFKKFIDMEWENFKDCDLYNKTVLLFSMMENISLKAGVNPSVIKKFFVYYGPIGLATYTQNLVVRTKVYTAMDSDGKRILAKIANFKADPVSNSIDGLFRAYLPLMESVDKLYQNLVENPHCILTGLYENKGIICSNLIGCFAFRIFDRPAPLGFNVWIESAKGGKQQ